MAVLSPKAYQWSIRAKGSDTLLVGAPPCKGEGRYRDWSFISKVEGQLRASLMQKAYRPGNQSKESGTLSAVAGLFIGDG